jgi:hypothetical protein
MGHEPSIDNDEIINNGESLALVELQANAFAAEFLAPKWLLFQHGKRQGWNAASLANPVMVYQLALRLGLSYEATCITLKKQNLISCDTLQSLRAAMPKKIKRQLLPTYYEPENWHQDVWLLTERDHDTRITSQPGDLFVLQLKEDDGAGYSWNVGTLREAGFTILGDERLPCDATEAVGRPMVRRITVGSVPEEGGVFSLMQSHPSKTHNSGAGLMIPYAVCRKEKGLPQMLRHQILAGYGC